ncbi:hypothetical protein ABPG75_010182 [Micractinium tetrahymenae]
MESEFDASLAEAEAAEAGLAAPAAQAAGPRAAGPAPAASEQRQKLKARARKVKAQVLAFAALSTEAVGGPVPALPRARRRHKAVMAVQAHLMHLIDCLLMAVHVDEAREQARAADGRSPAADSGGSLSPTEQQLVQAVGQQIGESLRCLPHVLAGRLPMAQALATLPALDALLHRLAEAAGHGLRWQLLQRHRASKGAAKPGSNGVAVPDVVPAPKLEDNGAGLMPFTAASVGAARTLRGLYHTLALAVLPEDAPAVEAAAAEVEAGAAGVAAVAVAQAAALAASLGTAS